MKQLDLPSLDATVFSKYASQMVGYSLGGWVMASLVFALLTIYNQSKLGLAELTTNDLNGMIKHNMWKLFKFYCMFLLMYLVLIPVFGLFIFVTSESTNSSSAWIFFVIFLLILVFIFFLIPLAMVLPVYILEDLSLRKAFAKGYQLGWRSYWSTLGISVVASFITGIIHSLVTLPVKGILFLLFTGTNMPLFDAEMANLPNTPMLTLYSCIANTFDAFVYVLVATISVLAICYQYSAIAEREYGMSVDQGIQDFEHLGEEN